MSDNDSETGIWVTGEGIVTAPPDIARLNVGVAVQARTVAEARERAATAANAVIDALKAHGIAPADIQTADLSIQPVHDYQQGREPLILGYSVTNTVNVKVRALDALSTIIDDVAGAGGDAARLNSISFGFDDDTAMRMQARTLAVQDARARAEQLASAAGVRLGAPVLIRESQGGGHPVAFEAKLMRASAADSTPVEAGTGSVRVSVNIRYAIDS